MALICFSLMLRCRKDTVNFLSSMDGCRKDTMILTL